MSRLLTHSECGALTFAGVAVTVVAAALLIQRLQNRRTEKLPPRAPLPPGPRGLPIIGNLLDVDPTRAHETLAEFCEKYGPIVSYRLGSQWFIVVNDYHIAKELLEDPNFVGRPQSPAFQRPTRGCGILYTEGTRWKQQRRFAHKAMRSFGLTAARSEEMVRNLLEDVLAEMSVASESGRPIQVLDAFTVATNAFIATLLLGRQFKKGDAELDFVRDAMRRLFGSSLSQCIPIIFPWTDHFVRLFPQSNQINSIINDMHNFIEGQIRQREQLVGADLQSSPEEADCLCDAFIRAKRRAEATGDFETFQDGQVIGTMLDLFVAGTDTTARSLEWLLIYIAFEQEWQTKVQAEIDEVIGGNVSRKPTMQDQKRLHLTCAVIEEVYRTVSLVSLSIFHRAVSEDSVFHGFRIPSDALIVPFIYGISRDPNVWLRPNDFYPEHFLSPEGTFTGPGKNVPFSTGRRVCVGESLARMEVFLIFSGVLQRFRVRVAEEFVGRRAEILRGQLGILRLPGDYRLVFEAR